MHARTIDQRNNRRGGLAETVALALAARLARGRLTMHLPDDRTLAFEGAEPGPAAEIRLRSRREFRGMLCGSELRLAEA